MDREMDMDIGVRERGMGRDRLTLKQTEELSSLVDRSSFVARRSSLVVHRTTARYR